MSISQPQIIRVSDRNQLNNSALLDSLYEGAIVYSQDTNELYIKYRDSVEEIIEFAYLGVRHGLIVQKKYSEGWFIRKGL